MVADNTFQCFIAPPLLNPFHTRDFEFKIVASSTFHTVSDYSTRGYEANAIPSSIKKSVLRKTELIKAIVS